MDDFDTQIPFHVMANTAASNDRPIIAEDTVTT